MAGENGNADNLRCLHSDQLDFRQGQKARGACGLVMVTEVVPGEFVSGKVVSGKVVSGKVVSGSCVTHHLVLVFTKEHIHGLRIHVRMIVT